MTFTVKTNLATANLSSRPETRSQHLFLPRLHLPHNYAAVSTPCAPSNSPHYHRSVNPNPRPSQYYTLIGGPARG